MAANQAEEKVLCLSRRLCFRVSHLARVLAAGEGGLEFKTSFPAKCHPSGNWQLRLVRNPRLVKENHCRHENFLVTTG